MILVTCDTTTGREREFRIPPEDRSRILFGKVTPTSHRVWETYVVSKEGNLYEVREDYYIIPLSEGEVEQLTLAQNGAKIVHHMEFKLRTKNLIGARGRLTVLGCRIVSAIIKFDKSKKTY